MRQKLSEAETILIVFSFRSLFFAGFIGKASVLPREVNGIRRVSLWDTEGFSMGFQALAGSGAIVRYSVFIQTCCIYLPYPRKTFFFCRSCKGYPSTCHQIAPRLRTPSLPPKSRYRPRSFDDPFLSYRKRPLSN